MKVFGLAVDEDSQVPVLILKDLEEKQVLPIWIGATEAMAISLALNEVKLPRPMTHDLLLNVFGELGAKVLGVAVVSLEDGTYYAEIEVGLGEAVKRIDSRPSDAIALALRAGSPIRVSEAVLTQAALGGKGGGQPGLSSEDADKWTSLLEGFDPDDKYKM
jgi:bifunctional DNase/RNase